MQTTTETLPAFETLGLAPELLDAIRDAGYRDPTPIQAQAIPLALKGVRYRALGAAAVLRRHLWIYGVGGIIIPFPGIKIIDMILAALKLV